MLRLKELFKLTALVEGQVLLIEGSTIGSIHEAENKLCCQLITTGVIFLSDQFNRSSAATATTTTRWRARST